MINHDTHVTSTIHVITSFSMLSWLFFFKHNNKVSSMILSYATFAIDEYAHARSSRSNDPLFGHWLWLRHQKKITSMAGPWWQLNKLESWSKNVDRTHQPTMQITEFNILGSASNESNVNQPNTWSASNLWFVLFVCD